MLEEYEKLIKGDTKIAVVGLGYVGLPLACAFSKKVQVIGFDINKEKIEKYRRGTDPTGEVGDDAIRQCTVEFTSSPEQIARAGFVIVAVPTPINEDKTPDLRPLTSATALVGKYMSPDTIVIYESTVYPGVTETICVPILEKESGMTLGKEFGVGYSPERINPGDKVHTLETITKIVSGHNEQVREEIASLYRLVVKAGIHYAPTIKVAEAAKLVENAQRDVNIGFMNELAVVFDRLQIRTGDVLEAMNTKWNALGYKPGLVGGHCIGVDPYYFLYQAEMNNYYPRLISLSRQINDNMGNFVAEKAVKLMIQGNKKVKGARAALFGFTFKENCPDIRNSRVIDIVHTLESLGVTVQVTDYWADPQEVSREYGIQLAEEEAIRDADILIFAVAHERYCRYTAADMKRMMKTREEEMDVVLDVKGVLNKEKIEQSGMIYWSL